MLNALIVDDEFAAACSLELLLKKFVAEVAVVGIARSADEAVHKVEVCSPNIVFLDIEMPGGSGFDFLEKCENRNFVVVFTTAYESYAVKAFKYSAVDYLLKPIGIDELKRAVEKASIRLSSKFDSRKSYHALFENIRAVLPYKLVVIINNRNEFIDLSKVAYFEKNEGATIVHYIDSATLKIDNKLNDLIEILDRKNFFRINDNQVVNTAEVKRVTKDMVELSNAEALPLLPILHKELVKYVEKIINN